MSEDFEKITKISADKDQSIYLFREQVVRLFECGIDPDDTCGYHGTSIETVLKLCSDGALVNSDGRHGEEIYYYPVDGPMSDKQALRKAQHYAEWNASKFYIVRNLGYRPKNFEEFSGLLGGSTLYFQNVPEFDTPRFKTWIDTMSEWQDHLFEAREHGLSAKKFFNIINASQNRKGVVLSFSPKILERYNITEDIDAPEEHVICSSSLSLECISGIEPLGQIEWDILVKLQNGSSAAEISTLLQ